VDVVLWAMGVWRLPADFDEFVIGAAPQLSRLAYRLTGDVHEADDLVQETLLRMARKWRVASENPVAYARRTIVNLAKDDWRRQMRRPRLVSVDRLPETPAYDATTGDREPLLAALRGLPARQRAVVVLRYWEDLSTAQTAALLGISEGTVKSTSNRALASLRSILERARSDQ
jgi:RNA polymerase sigma-70 factor (sigma-E family)